MVTETNEKVKRVEAATARRMRAEQAMHLGKRLSELKVSYAASLRRGDVEEAADIHAELVDAFDATQQLERIGFFDSLALITRCSTATPTADIAEALAQSLRQRGVIVVEPEPLTEIAADGTVRGVGIDEAFVPVCRLKHRLLRRAGGAR